MGLAAEADSISEQRVQNNAFDESRKIWRYPAFQFGSNKKVAGAIWTLIMNGC